MEIVDKSIRDALSSHNEAYNPYSVDDGYEDEEE